MIVARAARRSCLALLFAALWAVGLDSAARCREPAAQPASPLSSDDALAAFQLAEGLRIELAACEPEVVDPVEVRFDEDGRMWVVEMRDYPNGPPEGAAPLSRIRVLEDRDGDGRYETGTTFAEGLLFPTGVQPWRGGAFVTLAGRVAYMKDTDGDGRCDLDETWYTGFAEQNPQLRANHPRLALDGHIYVANGLRGGTVVNARDVGAEPVDIGGRDFRFDPHTGACEAASGAGQFGLTFDDYGNRFVCSNRNPLRHIVLEERYLRRNPLVAVAAAAQDVAGAEGALQVFPISRAWTTSNLHAGQITAACGVTIYRGDGLPNDYYGNAFICEPTGNLVQCQIVEPAGATFTSHPRFEDREFLASTDEWFRPVNLEVGPDGGLYVVDMYRAVIEHPEWVPDELKHRPDERYGDDRGRVWRIVREGHERRDTPQLSGAASDRLVLLLDHGNVWQREAAMRLLVERQDQSAASALATIATKGRTPAARVVALRTLAATDCLDVEVLRRAFADPHPRVREQALAVAERWPEARSPILESLRAIAADDDPRVRYQWALSLSALANLPPDNKPLLASAALSASDEWTRIAVRIAAGDEGGSLFADVVFRLASSDDELPASRLPLVRELAAAAAAQEENQRAIAWAAIAGLARRNGRLQGAALLGFAAGLNRRGSSFAAWRRDYAEDVRAWTAMDDLFRSAARRANDAALDESRRAEAVDLLALASSSIGGRTLVDLIRDEPSQALRIRAVAALARHDDPRVAPVLLADFSAQTPALRGAVLDAVIDAGPRATALLDEISAGRIAAAEIDRPRADRLLNHPNAQVAARAKELFSDALPADRQQILSEYRTALELDGDSLRGREVFAKNCAICHRIGEIGVNVAPDISDSRTKTPAQLLADILQPNRAIDANYVSYAIVTTDGVPLTGVIAAETATSVTLRMQEGKSVTLPRSDIEELRSTGRSLMPDGVEKTISPQAMADLISFIKNWRYLDGAVPVP